MQYKTLITIQPALNRLFEALAGCLPVELDTEQLTHLLSNSREDTTSPANYTLSGSGHVVLRAVVDASKPESESTWLYIDGNRRNLKTARGVCEAWATAYGEGASCREPAESQAIFERGLAEIG